MKQGFLHHIIGLSRERKVYVCIIYSRLNKLLQLKWIFSILELLVFPFIRTLIWSFLSWLEIKTCLQFLIRHLLCYSPHVCRQLPEISSDHFCMWRWCREPFHSPWSFLNIIHFMSADTYQQYLLTTLACPDVKCPLTQQEAHTMLFTSWLWII